MNDEKYIGLDVHQATIVVAVTDSTGKLVMESILETEAATIVQFFAGLRGTLSVTFEEGTWSVWLYDLLNPHVDKLVVCNPRKNALLKDGNKSDRIDARKVGELLRGNQLKPVYHGETGVRMLRELTRSYLTIVKDLSRVMDRLKAVYRSWAIPCAGRDVYYRRHRAQWLAKIREAGVRRRADRLYEQLDMLQHLRRQARRELLAESRTQLQGDIARDISKRLRVQLSGEKQQRLGSAGTTNPESYRLYLEGRQLWYGRTTEGLKKSIDSFQQAIAADPNYALAYAGLGETYNVIPSYRAGITSRQAGLLADVATRKALELDDSLPEAHLARTGFLTFAWKWRDADQEFRRAIELDPNSAAAHYLYAFSLLVPEKRFDQAIEEFHVALALDPLSPIMNTNYATTLMDAHRYPEALAQFHKTIERDPTFGPAHHKLSELYATTGDFTNAVSELKKFAPMPGSWSGHPKGFRDLAISAFNQPEQTTWAALALSVTGDRNQALDYLEKALSGQEIEVILCIRYPSFDPIRSDPRYRAVVGRLGLPE